MATTQNDIREWLARGKKEKATHLVVVVDTFDHEDYPVFVKRGEDVRVVFDKYNGPNMARVMEVYFYARDLEAQLAEYRALHFD